MGVGGGPFDVSDNVFMLRWTNMADRMKLNIGG